LAAAKDDAHSALTAAQGALAQAQTIPVLKVSDNAAVISADAAKLPAASSLSDFKALAADLRAQNKALHNLVDTRQATFDLLATTKDHIARAGAAGKDVSSDHVAAYDALQACGYVPSDFELVQVYNDPWAAKGDDEEVSADAK